MKNSVYNRLLLGLREIGMKVEILRDVRPSQKKNVYKAIQSLSLGNKSSDNKDLDTKGYHTT